MIQPDTTFATRYRLIRRIGTGGYSEVWLAEDTLAGNMPVALKIFAPDKGLDEQGIALFSKEYALVFNLNHPNLLLPKHFDVADGSPFLVLPYCEAGSAFSKIGLMTESDLARFLNQAASALAYLHSQEPPIIHQDIKPDNFLIDDNENYLLTDFGISSKIRRTLTRSMGAQASAGTLAYMPPEKFSADKQLIKAGDIFSLGVTLYELLSGDLPFGDNGGLILKAGADVPNLPEHFHPNLNSLVKQSMQKEPWERPAAETLMESAQAFLKNGKWLIPDFARNTGDKETHPPQPDAPANTAPVKNTEEILETTWLIDIEMVFVKGGTFIMGCTAEQGSDCESDEKPAHTVTLSDFYIGKYEVTQRQWVAIMGDSASLGNTSYFKNCDDCPVEQVSWNDIQEFIKKLNQKTGKQYRLPTEAEWEYAARGGSAGSASTSSAFATKYAGSNNIDEVAWYISNSGGKTHPVGSKMPNELDIYDMNGNVWEWCADWFDSSKSGNHSNTHEPLKASCRALRGGGWLSHFQHCQVAERCNGNPTFRGNGCGFRLALSP